MGNKIVTKSLKPADMDDLLQATHFTEAEIKAWYKNFLKEFPEGKVNRQQFQYIYSQHFPEGDANEFANHVFRTFDRDADELLDFREFMTALNITVRGGPNERLKWAFQMYDIDHNGSIDREECRNIIKAICQLQMKKIGAVSTEEINDRASEKTDHIFRRMDKNKDGSLTLEEFIEGAKTDQTLIKFL